MQSSCEQEDQAVQPLVPCAIDGAVAPAGAGENESAGEGVGTARLPEGSLWRLRRMTGVALVAAAVLAVLAVVARRSRLPGLSGLPRPPAAIATRKPWFEGLEELDPELVHRLVNPDLKRDVEELKQIGMGDDSLLKVLNDTQVSSTLADLRELMAEHRRMKAEGLNATLGAAPAAAASASASPALAPLATATCAFHGVQTVLYLVEACLAINDAAQACPKADDPNAIATEGWRRGQNAKDVCAVDIMAIFAGFGWTSFFIATMCQQCASTILPGANCVSDVTAMVAALLDLGESATGIATDCQHRKAKEAYLRAKSAEIYKGNQSQTNLGWCVVHPMQASYWLFRAALFIWSASKDCGHDADSCAIDALYVISSFGWAAGFLASTVSDCQTIPDTNAYCASDIVDLVSALTMVSAQGVAFTGGCKPIPAVGGH